MVFRQKWEIWEGYRELHITMSFNVASELLVCYEMAGSYRQGVFPKVFQYNVIRICHHHANVA